uniref:Uncharacterized protein n=1 Tax=Rheinheimera sp. BAL341 TaxID=1708203 RepID=A0A486XUQ3_9GAMM
MPYVVTIFILQLFVFPAAASTVLTLAFDTPGISISPSEQNVLLKRVAAVSAAQVKLAAQDKASSADILLTTQEVVTNWHYSRISVGYVPSLIALSLQPHEAQARVHVAQLPRAYMLAGNDVHTLPLDAKVASLLQAKRYDVIVDESSGVFQHDIKSQLYRRSLYPGRPIRLATKAPALTADLERRAGGKNIQGVRLIDKSVRAITIQLIAKSFNPDKYLLQESAEDLGFLSLLQQKLAQFSLSSVTTSSADAVATLQQVAPACIVNYRKRPGQTKLIYSLPTQIYLGPRLYVSHQHPLATTLKTMSGAAEAMSFSRIAKQAPTLRFASLDALKKDIPSATDAAALHQFLPLARFETALNLLQRGRVDAVWIYPVMFRLSLDDIMQANNFASFVLQETGVTMPVYLACNDTADTRELVAQLNQLLLDDNFTQTLLEQNAIGLNDGDRRDYAAQYQHALDTAVATTADTSQ